MFSNEIKPLNVNYFIFQGPLEEKGLNNLQRAFNVHSGNIHRQIHPPPEIVRSESKDQDSYKANSFSERPDSHIFINKQFEIKEESKRIFRILYNKI